VKVAAAITVVAMLALAGCGGSGDDGETTSTQRAAPGASPEASPEAPATGPVASGDVPDPDRTAISATVAEYIDSLNRHRVAAVCVLFAPGALELGDLPRRRGGCEASLDASIGIRPPRGAPAWRRTKLLEAKATTLDDDRARVTATITHRFSDRNYVSVEDDVIYLELVGGRWLLAKPSGTFYRAVGYPEPPLRSLTPPPGW
jgi:hypothetical protein